MSGKLNKRVDYLLNILLKAEVACFTDWKLKALVGKSDKVKQAIEDRHKRGMAIPTDDVKVRSKLVFTKDYCK